MPGESHSRSARVAWVAAAALIVFLAWLAIGAATAGLAFLYSVPIGLAAWWFGLRPALATVVLCLALYAVGAAIHPLPHYGLAFGIRAAFFLGVALLFTWLGRRLQLLEHSAEELEAIRAALTPAGR